MTTRPFDAHDSDINEDLANRSRVLYNTTFTEDAQVGNKLSMFFVIQTAVFFQPMDIYTVRSAYENVELFTFAVNETLMTQPNFSCDGINFVKLLKNRRINLTTGIMELSSNGISELNFDIYGFDERTNRMKVCFSEVFYILHQIVKLLFSAADFMVRLQWKQFRCCIQ